MKDYRLQRMAAAGGILYFGALFTGFALDAKGDPDPALASLGEVASFMAEHPGRIASRYLVALAALSSCGSRLLCVPASDTKREKTTPFPRLRGEQDSSQSASCSSVTAGRSPRISARCRVRVLPTSLSCGRSD